MMNSSIFIFFLNFFFIYSYVIRLYECVVIYTEIENESNYITITSLSLSHKQRTYQRNFRCLWILILRKQLKIVYMAHRTHKIFFLVENATVRKTNFYVYNSDKKISERKIKEANHLSIYNIQLFLPQDFKINFFYVISNTLVLLYNTAHSKWER